MIELNRHYHDRGMKKWAGFYLSEHTAIIESAKTTRRKENPQKPQMSVEEISTLLHHAQLKVIQVSIQLESVDGEGRYDDDVVGQVAGYDELGIYINREKVGYDEIRHVELYQPLKWSDLSDR